MPSRLLRLLPLVTLLLTACAPKASPPTPLPAPPPATASDAPNPLADLGCPPPPPPEPPHSQPPPIYIQFGVTPEEPTLHPGEPLRLTVFLKNVARFPVTLDAQAPALELRPLDQSQAPPLWRFPLQAWAGITLQPGLQVTTEATWPGGDPGAYALSFDRIHFTVACEHTSPTTGGGGTVIHVQLPEGEAVERTVTPGKATEVDGITVRVDSIAMTPTGTRVTLWVSRLRAPADLRVTLLRDDGSQPVTQVGQGNRDADGGGVQVFADFLPIARGTKSLTVQVSDIGLVTPGVGVTTDHGPWRITVPLE